MNKSIVSACVLGASSLMLSTSVLAANVDPLTGLWTGTTTVVTQGTSAVLRPVGTVWTGTTGYVNQTTPVVVQPVSGVWNGATGFVTQGTTGILKGVTAPFGLWAPATTTKVRGNVYTITDMNTGVTREVRGGVWHGRHVLARDAMGCANTVFPGVCNGVKYTVTDANTGKQYMVTGVKQGTMDVVRGTKVIRYQYVMPVVRPL